MLPRSTNSESQRQRSGPPQNGTISGATQMGSCGLKVMEGQGSLHSIRLPPDPGPRTIHISLAIPSAAGRNRIPGARRTGSCDSGESGQFFSWHFTPPLLLFPHTSPNRHSLVGQLTQPGFLIVLSFRVVQSEDQFSPEALNKCVQDCQGATTATPVG